MHPNRVRWHNPIRTCLASQYITIQIPRAEIEKRIVDKHPAAYLLYAGQLWAAGRKDESVFWFYIGQLRYRFHLASSPGIDPSGDPALFASLLDTIGSPINLYAGGDPVKWAGLAQRRRESILGITSVCPLFGNYG